MKVEQHGDDRIDQEPADEDSIVVDPVELRTDRPEHGVERREDRDRRVAAELEADVDVEDEARQDAHEEPEQGKQHAVVVLVPVGFGKATRPPSGRGNRPRSTAPRRRAGWPTAWPSVAVGSRASPWAWRSALASGSASASGCRSHRSRTRGYPLDSVLAPGEQAAQQPDLPRDELRGADRRGVEAEDRGPAARLGADEEAVLVGEDDRQARRRAADVRRDERGQPRGGVEVDRVERAARDQPGRGGPPVVDDRQPGRRPRWARPAARRRACRRRRRGTAGRRPSRSGSASRSSSVTARVSGNSTPIRARATVGSRSSCGLERIGRDAEQVLAAGAGERGLDRRRVRPDGGRREPDPRVVEGARRRHAVERAQAGEHHQRGAGPDRREPGRRRAPDAGCPAARPQRCLAAGRRTEAHRGRSAPVRRPRTRLRRAPARARRPARRRPRTCSRRRTASSGRG